MIVLDINKANDSPLRKLTITRVLVFFFFPIRELTSWESSSNTETPLSLSVGFVLESLCFGSRFLNISNITSVFLKAPSITIYDDMIIFSIEGGWDSRDAFPMQYCV